jgi:D-alanyl-D-alanine carboxypeptidase
MSKKSKFLLFLIVGFTIFFVVSLFSKKEVKDITSQKNNNIFANDQITTESLFAHKYCSFLPKKNNKFNLQKLNEKAAIAVFFDHRGKAKILYKKNENKKLKMASLTKMMTAIIVVDKYDLQKKVKITKKAASTFGEEGRLLSGETISIESLLKLLMLVSCNDAATALSEVMGEKKFMAAMNDKATEIGLNNTHFANPHGLDQNGHYSTAEDLALLTEYSLTHYPKIWEILSIKETFVKGRNFMGQTIDHWAPNSNKLVGQDFVLGGKTGYTDAAGDAMILAMKAPGAVEGNVVMVLLGLGVAEKMPRTQNMYDWVVWGWNWGGY